MPDIASIDESGDTVAKLHSITEKVDPRMTLCDRLKANLATTTAANS
jgi:hypothetical protein